MYAHFLFNAAAALAVAAGWRYRTSAIALCIGLTTLFFMERGVYLNHAYLYCLYAGLLAIVPAHRAFSLDVKAGRVAPSGSAPAWALWLLRFQMAVVYLFAGIAKLDPDWLAARPMKLWLADRAWYPVIGGLLQTPFVAYAFAWGGLALDLLIVPALLWRRTRSIALAAAIVFHTANAVVFGVGTFPWFSLVATALFLPPQTFRRLPVLRRHLPGATGHAPGDNEPLRLAAVAALGAYVLLQLIVPARLLSYPGRTAWTEEGGTFAWRMMLRDKRGAIHFLVRDRAAGTTRRVDPAPYLTAWQLRTLLATPDCILQFAHWLARREHAGSARDIEVRAVTRVRLNGRPARPLVNPRVDLAREPRRLGRYRWVTPPPA